MKKQPLGTLFVLSLIWLIAGSCSNLPEERDFQTKNDSRADFYGTWHYPKNNIYYTITNNTLEAYMPGDKTGFTATISEWKQIENIGSNLNEYPKGYIVTATIKKMTGDWWIGIGDTDTWTWYMNNDKESIVTENGTVYFRR